MIRPRTNSSRPRTGSVLSCRRGSLLQEAILAIALTGILLTGVGKLLGLVAQQRINAHQRFVARQEVANVVEEIMVRPWSETTTESLSVTQPNEELQAQLPGSRIQVRVAPESENTRRIHVELTWGPENSHSRQKVALVAWRLEQQESQP